MTSTPHGSALPDDAPLDPVTVEGRVARHGWRVLGRELTLHVRTGSFARGADLVAAIARIADELDHHPDVHVTYGSVRLAVSSHDVGGLTGRDVALALAIGSLVESRGLEPDVLALTTLEVAIDALDIEAVRPFWAAVLGWEHDARTGDLNDPVGVGPALWFQQMDVPRPQRNRVHVDVHVARDHAEARVEAALAAGGRLVSDAAAPSFWVLADPEGNEACVCTPVDHEEDA